MTGNRKRPRSADRKEQILNETLGLIMHHGLSGATMTRIANKVGITEPALYRHFKNRKDIMLAALDTAFKRLAESISFQEADAAAYLRRVGITVHEEIANNPEITRMLFEFICAPPTEDLREPVVKYLLMFIKLIEYHLEEGIRQGIFREDIDLQLTAWESFSLGFTLSFANLMGLQEMLPKEKALHAVENIIERLSTKKTQVRMHHKPMHAAKPRRSPLR